MRRWGATPSLSGLRLGAWRGFATPSRLNWGETLIHGAEVEVVAEVGEVAAPAVASCARSQAPLPMPSQARQGSDLATSGAVSDGAKGSSPPICPHPWLHLVELFQTLEEHVQVRTSEVHCSTIFHPLETKSRSRFFLFFNMYAHASLAIVC